MHYWALGGQAINEIIKASLNGHWGDYFIFFPFFYYIFTHFFFRRLYYRYQNNNYNNNTKICLVTMRIMDATKKEKNIYKKTNHTYIYVYVDEKVMNSRNVWAEKFGIRVYDRKKNNYWCDWIILTSQLGMISKCYHLGVSSNKVFENILNNQSQLFCFNSKINIYLINLFFIVLFGSSEPFSMGIL